jgi:hypothetical protein
VQTVFYLLFVQLLEYEVRRLTVEISRCDCDRCQRPYDHCRRGAIYRRVMNKFLGAVANEQSISNL